MIRHVDPDDWSAQQVRAFARDWGAPSDRDATSVDLRYPRAAAVTSGHVGGEFNTLDRNAKALRLRDEIEYAGSVMDDLLKEDRTDLAAHLIHRMVGSIATMRELIRGA